MNMEGIGKLKNPLVIASRVRRSTGGKGYGKMSHQWCEHDANT